MLRESKVDLQRLPRSTDLEVEFVDLGLLEREDVSVERIRKRERGRTRRKSARAVT
jgi:hypothetical protein